MTTPFDRLGGEPVLRAIVDDFVDAMVADPMIGFFFDGVDRALLKQREYELTARFLGAEVPYSGRPIREAHARHRIMGGHFDRRRTILARTLERRGVPEDIRASWLDHVEKLRAQVTAQAEGQCD